MIFIRTDKQHLNYLNAPIVPIEQCNSTHEFTSTEDFICAEYSINTNATKTTTCYVRNI